MQEFIMLIGIPGCGKSTFSAKLQEQGYIWLSSDSIRNELNLHGQEYNAQVFDIMRKRMIENLNAGKSVVYDSTNLSRKNRFNVLERLNKIPCKKICYLFIVPLEVCMERNAQRVGYARVPDELFNKMLCTYNPPMLSEGFDEIRYVVYDGDFEIDDYDNLDNFDQDNPHHSHSLGEHMRSAYEYVKQHTSDNLVLEATKYHDIGKIYTKSYTNFRGEPSEKAHFYGHDNYGAYMYLIRWAKLQNMSFEDALYVSQLIGFHMRPLLSWRHSEKARAKDRKFMSEKFYNDLLLLHDGDMNAH
jgi:predicted kinase